MLERSGEPAAKLRSVSVDRDMISMRAVRKSFRTQTSSIDVLPGIDCSVREGEFVSIVGPSGCGKSTILKIAAGLLEPEGGSVLLAGQAAKAGRRDVGIMLQSPALLPWRTVLTNVLLPFVMYGEAKKARQRAVEVVEMVGLADFMDAYPWQLSGGMQQRASLARLLAVDPHIQLMDEPFGALDELTRERLNLELCRIHELDHKTVLFVTHSVREAVFLSDRVLVMTARPGKIAGEVDIGLPRPRRIGMVDDLLFAEASKRVRKLLGLWDGMEG